MSNQEPVSADSPLGLAVDAMTYKKLCTTARKWWDHKRPLEWTLKMHLEQPAINCLMFESDLAHAVAEVVKIEEQKKKESM